MGGLRLKYNITPDEKNKGVKQLTTSLSDFNKFNPEILGLGNLSARGEYTEALAAVFDLEGFTYFCDQSDPHLATPEFLNDFLGWLFKKLSMGFKREETKDKVVLWSGLPFFSKFMGDGVLFIWDTTYTGEKKGLGNAVELLRRICKDYITDFRPRIKAKVVRPPRRLRCGIARGRVISVGNGEDFIGPCINIASRLQKTSQLSFAFSIKGISLERCFNKVIAEKYIVKRIKIRGIDNEELIAVDKEEFDALPLKEKKRFEEA